MTTREQRKLSKIVREACGATGVGVWPIVDVDGFDAPTVQGESWHYETKGGSRIYHPSAYARRGWSNMVYCSSSRHIVVGRGWLIEQGLV